MDDSTEPPPIERVEDLLVAGELDDVRASLDRAEAMPTEDRKAMLRSLRELAEDQPSVFDGVVPALVPFLDDERAVALTTVKLFVAIAADAPAVVRPAVDSLTDRLADDEEFYFVRARAAEALGYVALADPDAVATPETIAELRIGLEFDEPEVTEKLAKALEHVALAEPGRLRHQAPGIATHLDDDRPIVRYHLTTALVATATVAPDALAEARDALVERLDELREGAVDRALDTHRSDNEIERLTTVGHRRIADHLDPDAVAAAVDDAVLAAVDDKRLIDAIDDEELRPSLARTGDAGVPTDSS